MATSDRPAIRYEDNAERRTGIEGWVCSTCRRFWGDDEHMARYCCATDLPCRTEGCTGRTRKGWTACDACRKAERDRRWAAMERAEWDGETPLCEFDGDRYYWDDGAVADLVNETVEDGGRVEDIRLVLCEREDMPTFEMAEWLHDHLPEDFDDDIFDEIDRTVNEWIRANAPAVWYPTGKAIPAETLRAMIEPENQPAD